MRFALLLICVQALAALPPLPGEALTTQATRNTPYTALLRQIFPDIEPDDDDRSTGIATSAIAVRELGEQATPEALENASFTVQSVRLIDSTDTRALLSFAADISDDVPARVLTFFDITAAPKLLDVAIVRLFPDDAGSCGPTLRLGATTPAYVCEAFHHNSSQGYQSTRVLFLRNDRIEEIVRVDTLNCNCGNGSDFEQSITLADKPDPGRAFRKLVIRVELKQARRAPRFYTAEYRWDPQRKQFVTTSNELLQLAAFNEKNY